MHLQTGAQVAIAIGDLLQPIEQSAHRAQHHQRQAEDEQCAAQQADDQHRGLLAGCGGALGDRRRALGLGGCAFEFAEFVDGIAHGIEAHLAVTKAQRAGGLRIEIDLLDDPLRYRGPLLKAAIELLDQRQCLGARLHGCVLLHTIVGLLEVFRMAGLECLHMLASIAVEQAALGDEGLIQVAIGIEQQADGRQMARGQDLAGVGDAFDATHPENAHQHQQ